VVFVSEVCWWRSCLTFVRVPCAGGGGVRRHQRAAGGGGKVVARRRYN
jgi:hypothetical protein